MKFVLRGVSSVTRVAQLTGADGTGGTTRFDVGFTDLGSMFEAHGKVWMVFGDTFATRRPGAIGGTGRGWRSNVLAWTTTTDPSAGLTIDGMITDKHGRARELLASKKIDRVEMTVIPTHGFEAGGAMYLHWMSVRHWRGPGEWDVNRAGLAKSTDQGQTWRVLDAPRWSGDSGFVQIAPFHLTEDGVDTLYVWGVPHGRFGGVRLAKVPASGVEDPAAWQYFTGRDDVPRWGPEAAAKRVVDDTVGELSVVWNPYLARWIMTYLKEGVGIVIREGLAPWGPWSDPILLVSAADVPGLYGPYLLPRYTANAGRTIYFTLSVWDPYQVFWYRADLDK